MSKQYEQFALEKWAEMKGWKIEKFFKGDGCLGIWYAPIDAPYDRGCHRPTIDHPFMHELIKGLDFKQWHSFKYHLGKAVDTRNKGPRLVGDGFEKAKFTAPLNDLIIAYWEACK